MHVLRYAYRRSFDLGSSMPRSGVAGYLQRFILQKKATTNLQDLLLIFRALSVGLSMKMYTRMRIKQQILLVMVSPPEQTHRLN